MKVDTIPQWQVLDLELLLIKIWNCYWLLDLDCYSGITRKIFKDPILKAKPNKIFRTTEILFFQLLKISSVRIRKRITIGIFSSKLPGLFCFVVCCSEIENRHCLFHFLVINIHCCLPGIWSDCPLIHGVHVGSRWHCERIIILGHLQRPSDHNRLPRGLPPTPHFKTSCLSVGYETDLRFLLW